MDNEEDRRLNEQEYEPTEQEVYEYCEWLGIDLRTDKVLSWIAREALKAPLPANWKVCYTEDQEVYYFNVRTGESLWDHPMDTYYKALFRQEKIKLEKKRRSMRLFSGSLPVVPLQDYYNEQAEVLQGHLLPEIPDHLTDPIDLRLFVDPIVLPTSGRTVSRRTIITNRWRDPFTREYVENRQLIPNVDKRNEVTAWLDSTTRKHFEELTAGLAFAPVLRLLPYVLDKECEVSLKIQTLLLSFTKQLLSTPAPSPSATSSPTSTPRQVGGGVPRRTGRRAAKPPRPGSAAGPCSEGNSTPPHPPPLAASVDSDASSSRGYQELAQLSDEEVTLLLGCLLTMCSAASIETLGVILDAVPQFRVHPVFRGFSAEVLHTLQLGPDDLRQVVDAAAAASKACSAPVPASNAEHIVRLRWVALLVDSPLHLNILEKLEWFVALDVLILMVNSIPGLLRTRATLVGRLLRGLEGWPARLENGPPPTVHWLVEVALADPDPVSRIVLVHDLLVHGGDPATEAVRLHREEVVEGLGAVLAADGAQDVSYIAMLGALMVFQDCVTLADFSCSKLLPLLVTNGLLPRMTRQQWAPRHFEQTITSMLGFISQDPDEMWRIGGGRAVSFLLKELAKRKKRNGEELQLRLDRIDAAEKGLRALLATLNWALLYLSIQGVGETCDKQGLAARLLEETRRQRREVIQCRVKSLAEALRLLLLVRLKPRQLGELHSMASASFIEDALDGQLCQAASGASQGRAFLRARRHTGPDKDQSRICLPVVGPARGNSVTEASVAGCRLPPIG